MMPDDVDIEMYVGGGHAMPAVPYQIKLFVEIGC